MSDDFYKFKTVKTIESETFDIRMDSGGYIFVTFIESIGAVFMESDFGAYGYIWGSIGNESLKDFFIGADKYYLSTKFSYNMPSRWREAFSLAKTIDYIKEMLNEDFPIDEVEDFYSALNDFGKEFDDTYEDGVSQRFVDEITPLLQEHDLEEWFSGMDYGMYSCIQHEASTGYKSLRDIIVPTIQAALKKLQQTKDL